MAFTASPGIGRKAKSQRDAGIGNTMCMKVGERGKHLGAAQGHGDRLQVLHLFEDALLLFSTSGDGPRDKVDILATFQFKLFSWLDIEPTGNGEFDLVHISPDRCPCVSCSRSLKCG